MDTDIAVALIGAFIVALGWLVSYTFDKHREDRRRRLELRLSHLSRQIEECYGPLFNLFTNCSWRTQYRRRSLTHSTMRDNRN